MGENTNSNTKTCEHVIKNVPKSKHSNIYIKMCIKCGLIFKYWMPPSGGGVNAKKRCLWYPSLKDIRRMK